MHEAATMTDVPIRTRLTVLRDGSKTEMPFAYCAAEARSVPLSRCAACGFATRFTRDERGRFDSVTCHRDAPRRADPDESGDRPTCEQRLDLAIDAIAVPVATAVSRTFVCVARDASLAGVATLFELHSTAFGLPVVDDHGRLVGILPRATVALALARSRLAPSRVDAMAIAARAVSERASLAQTLGRMRERGVQEMPVVAEDAYLVGVLRDIDALRALARSVGESSRLRIAG